MLTFNEYFGYKGAPLHHFKRKIKRTEVSNEKTGESIQRKKSLKKSSNQNVFILKKDQSHQMKLTKKTLKSSPFKSLHRKQCHSERKSLPSKKHTMNDQTRKLYSRFRKQDCNIQKQQVQNRKDSLIMNFFKRKENENSFKKSHHSESSLTYKIKNQASHRRMPFMNSEEQPYATALYKQQNLIERPKRNSFNVKQPIRHHSQKKVPTEKENFSDSNIFQSEASKDCILNPLNEEEDEYQMKRHGKKSSIIRESHIPKLKKMQTFSDSEQHFKHTFRLPESVQQRIKKHYEQLQKLLNFVSEICKVHKQGNFSSLREIYFCRRTYFAEINKMKDCLSLKNFDESCFKLSSCKISNQEIKKHSMISAQNLNIRLRQLESQIMAMLESLSEESEELRLKDPHDPYIKFENKNFETELINEISAEITELSQRIERAEGNERQVLIKTRANAVLIIILMAELCDFNSLITKFDPQLNEEKIYRANLPIIEAVIQKFQEMPL